MLFLLENDMEKSEKNKAKDRARTSGKVWKRIPATFNNRTTASGVTFHKDGMCQKQVMQNELKS